MTEQPRLKRSLGLPQMVLYGLGTTIGAGIYALIGELAGISGYMAPAAFLLALMMAGVSALSFAELSSRYPQAAGASLYIQQSFGSKKLALLVGLLVALAGIVSSAALVNAFTGYLSQFIALERFTVILIITLSIGVLAAWGIAESVFIAALITLIEIGGLLFVIYHSAPVFLQLPERFNEFIPGFELNNWHVIYSGALLAFYAFIGFEDMVDVAEEIKDVRTTLPFAIIITLFITTALYMAIMMAAVLAIPPAQLAQEKAPLVSLYQYFSHDDSALIGVIGMVAIINGALIQSIMASRVLYGLSFRGHLHQSLSRVHHFTRTPVIATFIVTTAIFSFALWGQLSALAEITSIIMLLIFSLVNLSLWRIKQREASLPEGVFSVPRWSPLIGFLVSAGFVLSQLFNTLW